MLEPGQGAHQGRRHQVPADRGGATALRQPVGDAAGQGGYSSSLSPHHFLLLISSSSPPPHLLLQVAGHAGVTGLLGQVATFQADAARLLEGEAELAAVERCLAAGEGLEIELAEVGRLRARAEQLAWLEETAELLAEAGEASAEAVRALEAAGLALQPCPGVERGLGRLQGLRLALEGWEERAAAVQAAGTKLALVEVERLVGEGEALSSHLPSLDRLREACRRAREWWGRAEALQVLPSSSFLSSSSSFLSSSPSSLSSSLSSSSRSRRTTRTWTPWRRWWPAGGRCPSGSTRCSTSRHRCCTCTSTLIP